MNKRTAVLTLSLVSTLLSASANANDISGRWGELIDWNLVPIHAVLTPQGKVMTFGTTSGGQQSGYLEYSVWDPALGTGPEAFKLLPNETQTDIFCAAQVVLPGTGEVLTAGGDQPGDGDNIRNAKTTLFDDATEQLRDADARMTYPRWYPTTISLPNGRVLVMGGNDEGVTGAPMLTPEVFTPGEGWRSLLGATSDYAWGGLRWFYPRSWVMPNGLVFGHSGFFMHLLDYRGDGTLIEAGAFLTDNGTLTSTSAMYSPGRILVAGGGSGDSGTNSASVIEVSGTEVSYRATSSMRFKRQWANATILPDGSVLVTGGADEDNALGGDGAALAPERWDPLTEQWQTLAAEHLPRLYHSTSLLMPDGRVLTAGGGVPGPLVNLNGQLFSPPYLFDAEQPAPRPRYTLAASQVAYGEVLSLAVDSPQEIARVTMVKTGAVTHSFNNDQRFAELQFRQTGEQVRALLPRRAGLLPAGYYMLFLIDVAGTPSRAEIVHVVPTAPQGS
ncbi:MAG: galactose oxidase early set domain-containing protein [Pseudomonadota bacterium]